MRGGYFATVDLDVENQLRHMVSPWPLPPRFVMEVPNIHDLGDEILIKIFSLVVGSVPEEVDGIFGSFFRPCTSCEPEAEPTAVSGFHNILRLPLVCKRWRKLVETTPSLWRHVSVGKSQEGLHGVHDGYHPVLNMLWWAKHRKTLNSIHITGHKTRSDGPLDTFNLGVISLLSGTNLRVLHLDDCFEFGATETLLPLLSSMANLEQLQVAPVADDFIQDVQCLTTLSKLRVLELQGMENACISMTPNILPSSLEVLGLGVLDISNDDGAGYLSNIKVLKLIEVDWCGDFCEYMARLPNLQKLILSDVCLMDDEIVQYQPYRLSKVSNLSHLKHVEIQGDLEGEEQGFFEKLGEEVLMCSPFSPITHLFLCFNSVKKMAPDFGQYENLTHLHLEGFNFPEFPEPILELPLLVDLGLTHCHLIHFPDTAPRCANTINELRLSNNSIWFVPRGLRHWSSLKTLDLSKNPIVFSETGAVLLQLSNLESLQIFQGKTPVGMHGPDLQSMRIDSGHQCPDCAASFQFGYLCGELQSQSRQCKVYV